ncbi:hypothetical protein ACX1C1_23870 [Paenibacillus sp. strain BS8-2]
MDNKKAPTCFRAIRELHLGHSIDEGPIIEICQFIDLRYDCADFRMVSLIRTIYAYKDLLSEQTAERIKKTILGFKYWIDEPGEDSMCYWSENHQILFASVEYLAGQLYPAELFVNDRTNGEAHLKKARIRVLSWLRYRFDYGFTEWHSNVYYEEDMAALSILIDFCQDEEITLKSKMIMDLLLLDMGMHSFKGLFAATSGRCYEHQKKNPNVQNTLNISEKVWGFGHKGDLDYSRISANFLLMDRYDLPEVIYRIGLDQGDQIIKDSMGLDLQEIRKEFSDPTDLHSTGMFLWSMESFINPESVNISYDMFNAWKLHNNRFLIDFRKVNVPLVRKLGMLPGVSRLLNPVYQGTAIQRANSYTYKTKDYMLSTVQNHHPGTFSDQQHVWQATLSNHVTVFTTHPGAPATHDVKRNGSPGYWVGNGVLPHSAQDRNVHFSIYRLDVRKGFMEKERADFTHAYFPYDKFDEVVHEGRYLFGKLGRTYIALIGKEQLEANPQDASDVIQRGLLTYWICELGNQATFGSFHSFIESIRARSIRFHNNTLVYKCDIEYALTYKGNFRIDGKIINTNYDRFDTPFVKAERKPKEINVSFEGSRLYLNFERCERRQQNNDLFSK